MNRMWKGVFAAALLALTAAAAGCAEAVYTDETSFELRGGNGCHWRCNVCPPNRFCTQECEPVGNCPTECTVIALCIEGYNWDETLCECVPAEPCGAGYCPAGEVCCNASCGICTPPDGVCIQIACEPTTAI